MVDLELQEEVVDLLAQATAALAPKMWHQHYSFESAKFYLEFGKEIEIELFEGEDDVWHLGQMYVKRKGWWARQFLGPRERYGLPPVNVGYSMTKMIKDFKAGKELKKQ